MKLKIGDRIYIKQYGGIRSIQTITRITPTMAKSDRYSFDLDISESGYVKIKGQDKWASESAYIETAELKKELYDKNLYNWMRENWQKIPLEEIEILKAKINNDNK